MRKFYIYYRIYQSLGEYEYRHIIIPLNKNEKANIDTFETWTDIFGVKHEDFKFGNLYENKEDLPNYYEISYARAIHLGAVKIEIKPL